MASPQAKTAETLQKDTGSYNGCDVEYAESKAAVENSLLETDGEGFNSALTPAIRQAITSLFPKFNPFIQKTATCWLWTASVDAYGYGQIHNPGFSPMKAHRLAWMFRHGPITSKQHVLHKCDTPRCVNPDHLFLGDQAANMKDAAAKGRLSVAHPKCRTFSAEQEEELQGVYAQYPTRRLPNGLRHELAERYGVTPHYISMIGRGSRRRTGASA